MVLISQGGGTSVCMSASNLHSQRIPYSHSAGTRRHAEDSAFAFILHREWPACVRGASVRSSLCLLLP